MMRLEVSDVIAGQTCRKLYDFMEKCEIQSAQLISGFLKFLFK